MVSRASRGFPLLASGGGGVGFGVGVRFGDGVVAEGAVDSAAVELAEGCAGGSLSTASGDATGSGEQALSATRSSSDAAALRAPPRTRIADETRPVRQVAQSIPANRSHAEAMASCSASSRRCLGTGVGARFRQYGADARSASVQQ